MENFSIQIFNVAYCLYSPRSCHLIPSASSFPLSPRIFPSIPIKWPIRENQLLPQLITILSYFFQPSYAIPTFISTLSCLLLFLSLSFIFANDNYTLSITLRQYLFIDWNLHSTMYLLILNPAQFVAKMKMPLHSTMYLLISIADFAEEFLEHTLHSTMYLLIWLFLIAITSLLILYIPLCIY